MKVFDEPILKILEKLEARGSSGILELHQVEGKGRIYIYFYDGSIEAASSDREEDRLGQSLLRERLIDAEGLQRLLKKRDKNGKAFGEILVESKVLEPAELAEFLTAQVIGLVSRALAEKFEPGAFNASTKGLMKHRLLLSASQVALEMARRRPLHLRVPADQPVELRPGTELKALSWRPEEISVLTHLRHPATVSELCSLTSLDEETVTRVLQLFHDLDLLVSSNRSLNRETALIKKERLPLDLLVPSVRNPAFNEKVLLQDSDLIKEQFRTLKVRLQNQVEPAPKVLGITSPLPQDGKSLVSLSLALSFSREPGRRVLLVDCDLRGASLHEKLGIPLGPGLVQYLLEGLDPQCYLRRVGDLYVMTAGDFTNNAVELLSLGRMKELTKFVREQFDTVIFDSPPILPIADARVIAGLTDATLLVIYQGKTAYRMIQKAVEIFDKRRILGVILNGVKATGFDGYYSYGYYYAYPYHSGKSKDGVIELKAKPRGSKERRSGSVLFKG